MMSQLKKLNTNLVESKTELKVSLDLLTYLPRPSYLATYLRLPTYPPIFILNVSIIINVVTLHKIICQCMNQRP
jgi:hypothetical protein